MTSSKAKSDESIAVSESLADAASESSVETASAEVIASRKKKTSRKPAKKPVKKSEDASKKKSKETSAEKPKKKSADTLKKEPEENQASEKKTRKGSIEEAIEIKKQPKNTAAKDPDAKKVNKKENAKNKDSKKAEKKATVKKTETKGNSRKAESKNDSKPPVHPADTIEKLKKQVAHLNVKSTQRIDSFYKELNKLSAMVEKTEKSLLNELENLSSDILEKIAKNSEYQTELQKKTEEIVKKLEASLEAGKSEEALTHWDTIQGNISNTSGKVRNALQTRIGEYKVKLDELKSWKTFASSEKKKELISQMKHLVDSKMHASDRSKHINKMHAEWKNLGHSNQNESLWKEFKKLSDKAYEPCKAFFKKRKESMSTNLKNRRIICDALETKLEEIEGAESEPSASETGKLIHSYETDWKKHAPVEQSKIKNIQKRFYSGINKLRKTRRKQQQANAALKKQCIIDAQTLSELEDNGKAMSEAKKLQSEWKKIGSTSYREDEKYWKEFRAACDKIFSKRTQESADRDAQFQNMENALNEILAVMENLLGKAEEEFRSSRNDFQELTHKFSITVDAQFKKRRKRLIDNFNALKRKIEVRYSALPDKKQQELKGAIDERVAFLQAAEDKLLACKSEDKFKQAHEALQQDKWSGLAVPSKAEHAKTLEDRFEKLVNAKSLKAFATLAKDNENQQRNVCISSELSAEIDSPEKDQALRMQLQLQLLQKGFGHSNHASKQDRKELFEMEMRMLCLGPIKEAARIELQQRMEAAFNKLRQKSH